MGELPLRGSSRGKLVLLRKEHLTCLSDNYFVWKVEETMSVIPILRLLISTREKKISDEEVPHHVNHVNQSGALVFRKLNIWMFWGEIAMTVELCFERKYASRGFKKWNSVYKIANSYKEKEKEKWRSSVVSLRTPISPDFKYERTWSPSSRSS